MGQIIHSECSTGPACIAWRAGFVALLLLFMMGSCGKPTEFTEFTNPYDELSPNFITHPNLNTLSVHGIRAQEAWSGGEFTSDYGRPVTAKGVCWGTEQNPTTGGQCTNEGGGLEAFESRLSNLEPDQAYYVRAYATNADTTIYGGQREFTTRGYYPLTVTIEGNGEVHQQVVQAKTTEYVYGTQVQLTARPDEGWVFSGWSGDASGTGQTIVIEVEGVKEIQATFITTPQVSTTSVSNIMLNSAQSGGTISDDGGSSVTARGVCWSTSQNPTTSDTCTSDGAGTGTFTSTLANLNPDTRYYVRAYASNSVGTAYGNQQVFTTSDGIPQLSTSSVTGISLSSAQSGGTITNDGGAAITHRGVCWSTSQNPTTSDTCTSDGAGTGTFTSSLANLIMDTRYYVRAYATNSVGTAYGNQREFRTSEPNWPRDTNTTVVEVTSPTGRIWMDRNLGATRRATSSTDSQGYGDLYQWGRAADGHQRRDSPTTSTLSSSDQPGHGSFILISNSPWDWRSRQNNNLWQGVNGINNPCPSGYRLPTEAEWNAERQSWSSNNAVGAFNSPLRLPVAGYRNYSSGSLFLVGSSGLYWSGTADGTYSRVLPFSSSRASMSSDNRANGLSVRCLKD